MFAWLLHRIGLATVARSLARIGWGFAAVMALESVSLLLATFAWRATLPRRRPVPLRSLFAMRLAGDAVNSLAPAAVVGGEVVRARLLSRFLPLTDAVTSVGLAALAQFVAQILFVGLGSFAVPAGLLPAPVRLAGLALLGFLALCLALVSKRRGSSTQGGTLTEVRSRVSEAFRDRPGALALSSLIFLAGWALASVEVALILRLLGSPVPFATAFSIAVLMVFVEGVLFFVPARAGVAEGGLYGIFSLLGLNPATGFSLAIVRRLRELLWGVVGLTILGFLHSRARKIAVDDRDSGGGGEFSGTPPRPMPSWPTSYRNNDA